jgi:TPR repeat protein
MRSRFKHWQSRIQVTMTLQPFTTRLIARATVLALVVYAGAASAAALLPPDSANREDMVQMLRADALRHEFGDGVARDPAFAAALYCRAARLGDPEAQFHLGWIYANGRGVERKDSWAAYFLRAAAEQGIPQAPNMLKLLGSPESELPDCMREPTPEVPPDEVVAEPPKPKPIVAPKAIADLVNKMAPEFRVQPQLALAIIKAESNFDSLALSPKNAMGLMQLIPETAERFNVKNAYDAKQNIRGGLAYLRWLLAYFEGDVTLVAAAYNSGEGTVDRYLGVPPYRETRSYVQRVLDAVGIAAHPFDAKITQPSLRLRQIREPKAAKAVASR